MKIKVTLFALAIALFASAALFAANIEAAVVDQPSSVTDDAEGSNSNQGPSSVTDDAEGGSSNQGPSSVTDDAEGDNSNGGPGGITDDAEGENVPAPTDNGDDDEDEDDDNNGSSRGSSGQKKSSNRPSSEGEVLGAFTGSCPFLTTFMRMGQANDAAEVAKLQEFLNAELNISLPVTGFFGELTTKAVNDFQLKYKDEVLKPWVDAGLHASENVPTGYVYLTTQHMINSIVCPDLDIAEPVLPTSL